MRKIAYLAMDVHAKHCVLGDMDFKGTLKALKRSLLLNKTSLKRLKLLGQKQVPDP